MQTPRVRLLRVAVPLALLTSIVPAQQAPVPHHGRHTPHPAVHVLSAAELSGADALRRGLLLGDFTLQRLELPGAHAAGEPFAVQVELAGQPQRLELYPHSLRGPRFELLVQDDDGLRAVQAPPAATYRGHVAGLPQSTVAASLHDGRLTAWLRLHPEQPPLGIQPAAAVDASFDPRDHVVFDAADVLPHDGTCGVPDLGDEGAPVAPAGDGSPDLVKICQIACDADFEFYDDNGESVAATEADIEGILNAVEAIYEADTGVLYELTTVIVRATTSDPYTTTSPSGLLGQFEDEWNAHNASVPRDVAHLFTGRNLSGSTIGIATLNSICALGNAYGLSESNFTSNFTSRVALTAHELGHNWSSPHCNGQPTCKIMCSSLGGCGPVTSFGFGAISAITNKKAAAACLEDLPPDSPPILSAISQPQVAALSGGQIVLNGSNLLQVDEVAHGDVVLTEGQFQVTSNWSISYQAPDATALGPTPIVVTNAAGSSTELVIETVPNDPPLLEASFFAINGQPFRWTWGGQPGSTGWLIVAIDPATFPYEGFDILLNLTILVATPIPGSGIDSFEIVMPAAASGLFLYSQVAVIGPGGFEGASNIVNTVAF